MVVLTMGEAAPRGRMSLRTLQRKRPCGHWAAGHQSGEAAQGHLRTRFRRVAGRASRRPSGARGGGRCALTKTSDAGGAPDVHS